MRRRRPGRRASWSQAKKELQDAEREIEKIEKFLGR